MVLSVRGRAETTGFQHEGSTETDIVLVMLLKLDLSWSGPTLGFFGVTLVHKYALDSSSWSTVMYEYIPVTLK
jgi:hypothetical protein